MSSIILETGNYLEFMKRYQKGKPFGVISAFNGNMSKNDNKSMNVMLRSRVRERDWDMLKVIGHYEEDNSYYECMIIFADEEKELLSFLSTYAKRFHQNSFFYVDTDSNIWQVGGDAGGKISPGQRIRYDKFIYPKIIRIIEQLADRHYETDLIRTVND